MSFSFQTMDYFKMDFQKTKPDHFYLSYTAVESNQFLKIVVYTRNYFSYS